MSDEAPRLAGLDLPAGDKLADNLEAVRGGGGLIGHSSAAHAVHGWCSQCAGRTLDQEVIAWRNLVQLEAAFTHPGRTDEAAATVVVDFDGPLHDYLEGWHDGTVYGGPVRDSGTALAELMAGFAVVIGTARPNLAEVAAAVRRWYGIQTVVDTAAGRCAFWSVRGAVLVTNRKVPAIAYIDDRAFRWAPPRYGDHHDGTNRGGWPSCLEQFNAWHRHKATSGPAPFVPVTGGREIL